MGRMRHVLIVCYDFPRISAAGVIRTYQFANRLTDFGWQPVILTAQRCGIGGADDIEASDSPLRCTKLTVAASRFPFPVRVENHGVQQSGSRRVFGGRRMRRLLDWGSRFAVPDGKLGWLYPAIEGGFQIAQRYPIRMCFSVSPRPTAHFVGYRLARRLRVPWVADFALPWSDAHWLNGRPALVKRLDRRLERRIVRSAEHVTVAYADLARSLAVRHEDVPHDKISVIPTGFNEDLFVGANPASLAKFTVVYPGNHLCENGRHGEYFLRAIDQWIDSSPGLEQNVEFVFIGKRDDNLLSHRAAMAHPEVIRVEPLMSHRACVEAILSADLCVVNTVGNRIPAKVYECMRAGKWILALTDPNSDLAKLTNHYARGMVVPAENSFAIRRALQKAWRLSRYEVVEAVKTDRCLSLYSAKRSAGSLALIFERLLQS